jgi:transglutaminase-like putative cysteine protease
MLRPREGPELRLRDFRLEVTPEAVVTWAHDVAGNAVATASFDAPTDRLVIDATATLELGAAHWPVFAMALEAMHYPFAYADDDRLDLGALAVPQYPDPEGELGRWAYGFVAGTPTDTLALLKDLGAGVHAALTYVVREDEGTQAPLVTLGSRSGSCRDFAVLFAEAVRWLGFGARLVSGYLHDPDGDATGTSGAGSTHAWVEVYVPGAGWIAFDPTNGRVGGAHLVPVAVGRGMDQIGPSTVGATRMVLAEKPIWRHRPRSTD